MQKTTQANPIFPTSMRLKTLSAAVLSVLLMSQAYAAGLGKLTVLSGLGQPLRAEIELTAVSAEEVRSLQPKLASLEAFRKANIEFSPSLQSLRFAIEERGARQFIRITSVQPMNEPFVDVLLELNSVNGRLVREYTFLLDPPELRALQPAQTSSLPAPNARQVLPAVAATPSPTVPAERVPADRAPTRAAASERAEPAIKPDPAQKSAEGSARPRSAPQSTAAASGAADKQYRVQNGDSLSKIANRNRAQGVSLDQMLVALYRANPDAFINNNMNRLRAGQILAIPSADASASVDALDAQGQVIAQAADFNDYRNKLAGQVATGTGRKASESRQSASGKIAAKVEESPTPANESLDKLKLSKASGGDAAKTTAAQEDKIAQEKAAAEAAARLKDLEKNVGDLQKMLEIKSRDLAARQKAAELLAAAAVPPVTVASTPAAAPVPPPALSPASAVPPAVSPAATNPAPAAPAIPPAGAAATPTPAPAPAPAPATTSTTPVAPVPVPPVAATPPAAAAPAAVTPPAVAVSTTPAEPAEAGMFDDPVNNPVVQGSVVLALLLGALALVRSRRKKPAKEFLDTSMADTGLKANSLFGSSGGQTVDTSNSVFNSSFAPSPGNLDSNEVDPVAEADVYIAYGRDAQAEEILKEALRTQPERHAVRVKLLEIYASRKDVRAFESIATELYGLTKGEGEDWAQAATLGLALDPANPLYVGGEAAPTVPATDTPDELLDEKAGVVPAVGLTAVPSVVASAGIIDQSPTIKPRSEPVVPQPPAAFDKPANSLVDIPADAPADAPADNNLDFDLNGLDFGSTEKKSATAPVQSSSEPSTSESMVAPLEISEAPTAKPAPLDEALLAGLNFDFLDKPAADTSPAAAPASVATSATDDPKHKAPGKDDASLNSAMLGEFSLDLDAPPADTGDKAPGRPAQPDPLEFDLSGISLELPDTTGKTSSMTDDIMPAPSERTAGAGTGTGSAGSSSGAIHQEDFSALDLNTAVMDDDATATGLGNNAEMATKLDLAVAYQEIGDQEGARELLDEVLKGGNAEQSEKAKALLARLT
ncbi:MAG: FimV/HubP family polar landmark protein [Pseudomonadota bacterium]